MEREALKGTKVTLGTEVPVVADGWKEEALKVTKVTVGTLGTEVPVVADGWKGKH